MASCRDAFGVLEPLSGPSLSTARCSRGASLFSAGCGKPAEVVFEGWCYQTTMAPPYQPRCHEHRSDGDERGALPVPQEELPATMRGHYQP